MSTPSASASRHRAAIHHMQSGEYRAAINVYDALLRDAADDTDLLNDAALAYALAGETRQAEQYFRRALDLRPDHEAAFFNLLDMLLEQKNDLAASDAFETYASSIPTTEDKYRYAKRLDKASALAPSGDGAPATSSSKDTLNVAFVCGPDRKFITDIEREVANRHAVRTAYFDEQVNLQQIQRVMEWADVTWFEWCDNILVHASQKLRKTSRVVCRLHRYEAFSSAPRNVNWSFVDTLITTTRHIQNVLDKRAPDVLKQTDTQVISSTVDIDRYTFNERIPGYNLAYLGYLHHRKNPSLLLQCLHALVQENDQYHLHIAGYFQQPVWEYYFEHMLDQLQLRDHVTLHGWVDDVKTWLDDKHYLVLPTIHEGNPYSVLEAAACGIKPLVHNFAGSEELYPESWTFNTPAEFVEQVEHGSYTPEAYRSYVADRYSLRGQIEAIDHLLDAIANRSDTNPSIATPASEAPSAGIMDEAKQFYDQWTRRLIGDYARGNPRVVDATTYALRQISSSAKRILDLGCGIGWSTHEIKRHFGDAQVVGVDLSASLIDIALKLFSDEKDIDFISGDITKHILNGYDAFDAIVMMDVYEHIPIHERNNLHENLSRLLASAGTLILSCPTPKLQKYLAENAPEKLQPVDEIVTRDDLKNLAGELNAHVADYKQVSIWLDGDYFQATIRQGNHADDATDEGPTPSLEKQEQRIKRIEQRLNARIKR